MSPLLVVVVAIVVAAVLSQECRDICECVCVYGVCAYSHRTIHLTIRLRLVACMQIIYVCEHAPVCARLKLVARTNVRMRACASFSVSVYTNYDIDQEQIFVKCLSCRRRRRRVLHVNCGYNNFSFLTKYAHKSVIVWCRCR